MDPTVESLQSQLAQAKFTANVALIGAAVFAGIAAWQWSTKAGAITRAERDTLRETLAARSPTTSQPVRRSGSY